MTLLLLLAVFGVLLLLDLPIAAALGLACFAYLLVADVAPLVLVAQRAVAGIDSFTLLAIPLFLLAGKMLHLAGLTERLVALCIAIVGPLPGGLAVVLVLACMLFGTLSGSGTADILAIGTMLLPAMRERGYPPEYSAALLSTAGSLSTVIPPSIVLIVYGAVTNTSVAALYGAALIPAIVGAAALMLVAQRTGRRHEAGRNERLSLAAVPRAAWRALPALGAPAIVILGIRSGMFTPTEAAAILVLYALIVGVLVQRRLEARGIVEALKETAEASAAILLVITMASAFAWILTAEQVPQDVSSWISGHTSSPVVVLIMMMCVLLLFGTFMETIAIILILAPVFLPLLRDYGIDPVLFGVLLTINLAVGANTPPVAVALLAASRVAGVRVLATLRHLIASLSVLLLLMVGMVVVAMLNGAVPWQKPSL